ncbi:chromatin associated protein KTI12 [Pluteus cervinus]|uniref:Chromatin associated protein KTI12 n=1 Tax=Pluteus cervinus TaxID=181527 RepID=A0ACD3BB17_9AGAR|nr:chromatin associated protein KTI12 [Pluteus cervinus]
MALVTLSGFPCSGKSSRATQLRDHLEGNLKDPAYNGPQYRVLILSDEVLNVNRAVYSDSRTERTARGTLFAAVLRELATDKIVVLDGLNYIKGFRYQLYCAAREAKVRTCTVYVAATHEQCKSRNQDLGNPYSPDTLENLLLRYEEPSSMARWDSPLFTLWDDDVIPGSQIWDLITKGDIKAPNMGTVAALKSPSDALHVLEQITSNIVSAIIDHQGSSGSGGSIPLSGDPQRGIVLSRLVTMSELQRLKRQFVFMHKKVVSLGATEKGSVDWDPTMIRDKFIAYVQEYVQ